ncbi:hypothetical protein [Anaplasma ovis]|uniref:hypothetical protein n=1 Tax=Anaplasma ovis TaxID=142058 RepID=UPI00131405D0|nr:hypothetical protein [Anaplasma ovis]
MLQDGATLGTSEVGQYGKLQVWSGSASPGATKLEMGCQLLWSVVLSEARKLGAK